MRTILDDSTYTRLKKDPTKKVERRVNEELRHLEHTEEINSQTRSRLAPNFTLSPQVYGLPKIHKENIPLRPIVCTIGSPTYALAKELARVLSPLTGQSPSYIKNSAHFVERIKTLKIDESDLLVSFDVQSLFTRVPIDEAMTRVAELLSKDEMLGERTSLTPTSLCALTELCLKTTYFEFRGDFYEQKDGAAMGSPLSPVIANIYNYGEVRRGSN